MNREPMPLGLAIFLLIAGLFLGSVFTFGMQYWNSEVTPEECTVIDTEFVSYEERHGVKRPMEIKEIAIDCANGERYFIDGVSINTDLKNSLSTLPRCWRRERTRGIPYRNPRSARRWAFHPCEPSDTYAAAYRPPQPSRYPSESSQLRVPASRNTRPRCRT